MSAYTFSFALAAACAATGAGAVDESGDPRDEIMRRVYASVLPEDEQGFFRKKPPRPGEWLSINREAPQSLDRYRLSVPNRSTEQRRTIVLQPLGTLNAEQTRMLEDLRAYAEAFFELPARIAKPLELPAQIGTSAITRKVGLGFRRGSYDTQYDADAILSKLLKPALPDDAICYLGITMEDLYSGELHYVHGLGSIQERVGVYSLCRYFPEFWNQKRQPDSAAVALRRACKVLNHETGHMFGLTHCVFYDCTMNGANSLQETDAQPIHECPVCHRKLLFAIGFDPRKRFAALRDFYAAHELKAEADFMQSRAANWEKVLRVEESNRQGE